MKAKMTNNHLSLFPEEMIDYFNLGLISERCRNTMLIAGEDVELTVDLDDVVEALTRGK